MSTTNSFRSHILQSLARQNKTPIALIGWINENEKEQAPSLSKSSPAQTRSFSGLPSSKSRRGRITNDSVPKTLPPRRKLFVASFDKEAPTKSEIISEVDEESSAQRPPTEAALSFQTLLKTRRTSSRLVLDPNIDYKSAIDRAVAAGQAAPNHKRTEAFSFKRLLAPSASTARLASIAGKLQRIKGKDEADAQRKEEKWNQIPAFLVTLVSTETDQTQNMKEAGDSFETLPFVPPNSERELEDYASACAATQNVLLSLHSEGIASKWATGSVLQTLAFRELVELESTDRVVALIMMGKYRSTNFRRRYRREIDGDLLKDL